MTSLCERSAAGHHQIRPPDPAERQAELASDGPDYSESVPSLKPRLRPGLETISTNQKRRIREDTADLTPPTPRMQYSSHHFDRQVEFADRLY